MSEAGARQLRYVFGRLVTRTMLSPRARRWPAARALYAWAYLGAKRALERGERRLLRQLAEPGTTVVDVGANLGAYTSVLVRAVGPTGSVHAFEPDPLSFAILRSRFPPRRYPFVQLNPLALGAGSGRRLLHCSTVNRADNRLFASPEEPPRETVEVEVTSFDEYRRRRGLEAIAGVKMDVQGGEVDVLEGMAETMRECRPDWLWLEFSPRLLGVAGASAQRFWDCLDGYGFDVFAESGGRLEPILDRAAFTRRHESWFVDVLARRRGQPTPPAGGAGG